MATLTTGEELQKQLSIIFGFSGRENEVGNIIGVGKLTANKIQELIYEVLRYINAYNSMLRDYSGTEIYAIEYDLVNFLKNKKIYSLIPKSMIFIPGEYKDCNTLLLALTHELSLLDVGLAKSSIDQLGKLFFEILEVVERPELNKNEKEAVLRKFAERFSYKIQGELLEGKWNKKLIGIKEGSTIENQEYDKFLTIQANYNINWHHIQRDISPKSPRYQVNKKRLNDSDLLEAQKWIISNPAAYYIIQNTLTLGANLLRIANTGTVNEVEEQIIKQTLTKIIRDKDNDTTLMGFEEFIKEFYREERILRDILKELKGGLEDLLSSGFKGTYNEIISAIERILNKLTIEKAYIKELGNILLGLIKEEYGNITREIKKDNDKDKNKDHNERGSILRIIDFKTIIHYFLQIFEISLNTIKENIERYIKYIYLNKLTEKLFIKVKKELEHEEKPAYALGIRFLQKLIDRLLNVIYQDLILNDEKIIFIKDRVNEEFSANVKKILNKEIDNLEITTEDLINFAETMLGDQIEPIKENIENLRGARSELVFLLNFILRYSTLNKFLQTITDEDKLDPTTLSETFYKFLFKRLGGVRLFWKDFVLEHIKEYGVLFQEEYERDLDEKKRWSNFKVIDKLIKYLTDKINNYIKTEGFINLLDRYIGSLKNPQKVSKMLMFFKQYEYSLGIINEFPKYFRQKVAKELNELDTNIEKQTFTSFLKEQNFRIINSDNKKNNKQKSMIENNLDFYGFLDEFELKYFSKLIARPSRIIMIGNQKKPFKDTLFYSIEFKFFERFFKVNFSNNFNKIKIVF